MNDTQYTTPKNLNARALLHSKYRTNKYPWHSWLFDQYTFADDARIIEFGCGTGDLWFHNRDRIGTGWKITLTDSSEGMLRAAREKLQKDFSNIQFRIENLDTCIPEIKQYSHCIANHMLYHTADRSRALSNIYISLKDGGCLYASTVSENNMREMRDIVTAFTGNRNFEKVNSSIIGSFSLENGFEQIQKYFSEITKAEYEDSLDVTDADDFVNYVISCNDLNPAIEVIKQNRIEAFRKYVNEIIKTEGRIHISKKSGTFIAGKN
jgi:ubiquinone/menaquinone biosynthesis C-methylase UbiE